MLRQRTTLLIAGLIIGGGLFVAGSISHAATATSFSVESIGGQVGLGNADLKQVVLNIIRWALGILTLAAVSYMIYGGYVWLTSGGNEARIEKAKQIILQAAIGLVIVLLAWAIVFFVVKTFTNVTNSTTGSPCVGPNCGCGLTCPSATPVTFDIVAVNTCAAPPVWDNVPRTSAVSFTFNNKLRKIPSGSPVSTTPYVLANDPIKKAIDPPAKNLILQHCKNQDLTCGSGYEALPVPATLSNQVYTPGNTTAGTDTTPLSEWLAIQNTLTFYHRSSNVAPDKNMFVAGEVYRVIIPITASNNGIRDIYSDEGRLVSYCRTNQGTLGTNNIDKCDFDVGSNNLLYTFRVGSDTDGPPIAVTGATPSDEYNRVPSVEINRNVSRDTSIAIFFDGGVDPTSITTTNFELYELTTPPSLVAGPTYGLCGGAECGGTQVNTADLDAVPYMGNGATLSYVDGRWLKPFTWYKVKVKDFRNLCGTKMDPNPYYWLFETNAVTPGVDFVYPTSGTDYSCPSTQVFAQFNTSMLNPTFGANTCGVNGDFTPDPAGKSIRESYETHASLWNGAGTVSGNWAFTDQPLPGDTDLSDNCRQLVFTPTAQLTPAENYHGLVVANRFVDTDGHTITVGDRPPPGGLPSWDTPVPSTQQKPWNFSIDRPESCVQQPVVRQVIRDHDANGACVSVIGDYFEKATDTAPGLPDPGDKLTLGQYSPPGPEYDQPAVAVKSWTGSTIVNKLDKGTLTEDRDYNYKVSVNYSPSPIGVLSSPVPTLASKFHLDAGAASTTRPCLYTLNPDQGPPGTQFVANGENFGTTLDSIQTTNASPWPVSGAWTNRQITGITVPAGASHPTPTPVRVRAGGDDSNPVQFTVTDPVAVSPGQAPEVVDDNTCNIAAGAYPSPNPYKDDILACLNTEVQVRFTMPLDPSTVNSSTVKLFSCPTPACADPVAAEVTSSGIIVTLTPGTLATPIQLLRNTTYKVELVAGASGIKGVPPGPSFTPGTGVEMIPFPAWKFTTQDTNDTCIIDDVGLTPNGSMSTNNSNYPGIGLSASTMDNACHTLTHEGMKFNWNSSNTAIGFLNEPLTDTTDDQKTLAPPLPNPPGVINAGSTDVTVAAQSFISPKFTLTYNPTACTANSDCARNIYGESCGPSTCVAGNCTPVINALDPDNGPISTWTTVKGCWFGTAPGKVMFSIDKEGIVPDPAQCGNGTWSNERIVREVPKLDSPTNDTSNDAVTGPVSVIRNNGGQAAFAAGFQVNTDQLDPGLCKVAPNTGRRDNPATLTGRSFATKAAGDRVTFTQIGSSIAFPVSLYSSWTDKEIGIRVPNNAVIAPNEVRVEKGSQSSNSLPYIVTAASACTTACQFGDDAACPAGQGCGYPGANGLGCCSLRPTVTGTAPLPGATNVCRNTTAEVEFSQPLDPATVNRTTVHYLNGYSPVDGAMAVRNDAATGTIVYQPGLLTANRPQSLILDTFVEQAVSGLQNPDFETWSSDTQPVGWDAARAKKSTDLPPGHTGSSVLVDCSTCTTGQQAYAAQDIAPAEPVGSRYRLTGWIKAEQPDGVKSGLITQCFNPSFNVCGYDLSDGAPGLFTGNSNGWKKIDVIVTKSANPNAVLHVNCFANPKAKVWCDDLTLTKIPAAPTGIRGQNGVLADVTGTPLTFNTGQNICAINTVAVEPTDDIFTALGEVHSDFKAEAYPAGSAAPIMPVTGKYEWAWDWSSETSTIASVAMTPPAVANPSQAAVTARANGTTMIKAKAKVTKDTLNDTTDREYYGQSRVRVKFCVNPWQFTDASTNCDIDGNGCNNFNFNLFYCRDNGNDPLPPFTYTGSATSAAPDTLGSIEGVNTTDPTRLKSFFFKESQTSRDTIGLLIFKNDEFLSPSDWFAKRFPLDTGASSTTVAGYPAVKSGTTTYVGVTDYDGAVMRGLMFVFDYNSNNASPETVNIADQMLSAIAFNTNNPPFLNADAKDQVIRDTKRRQDLTSLKLLLDAYKTKNGTYPALASGSYITGFSTSKWPSWQATLGAELGKTLPLDPTNTFSAECQAPYEAATCWAETDKKFTCPAGSHLYGYRAQVSGVDLYTTMEYTGPGSFIPSSRPSGICTSPSSCDCFNYALRVGPP